MSCCSIYCQFCDGEWKIIFWTNFSLILKIYAYSYLSILFFSSTILEIHVGYFTSRMNSVLINLFTSFSIKWINLGRKRLWPLLNRFCSSFDRQIMNSDSWIQTKHFWAIPSKDILELEQQINIFFFFFKSHTRTYLHWTRIIACAKINFF